MYIAPTLGRFSKLDCSTTKRAPVPIVPTRNHTSSESSRRDVSNAVLLLAPTLFQLWRYRPWSIGAGGCDRVIYAVLFGKRQRPSALLSSAPAPSMAMGFDAPWVAVDLVFLHLSPERVVSNFLNRGAWKKRKISFPGLRRHFWYGSLKVIETWLFFCPMHAWSALCSDTTTSATVRASPWK